MLMMLAPRLVKFVQSLGRNGAPAVGAKARRPHRENLKGNPAGSKNSPSHWVETLRRTVGSKATRSQSCRGFEGRSN